MSSNPNPKRSHIPSSGSIEEIKLQSKQSKNAKDESDDECVQPKEAGFVRPNQAASVEFEEDECVTAKPSNIRATDQISNTQESYVTVSDSSSYSQSVFYPSNRIAKLKLTNIKSEHKKFSIVAKVIKKEKKVTGFTIFFYIELADQTGKILAFFVDECREERFNSIEEEGVLF
jgi:hypothetical protein